MARTRANWSPQTCLSHAGAVWLGARFAFITCFNRRKDEGYSGLSGERPNEMRHSGPEEACRPPAEYQPQSDDDDKPEMAARSCLAASGLHPEFLHQGLGHHANDEHDADRHDDEIIEIAKYRNE